MNNKIIDHQQRIIHDQNKFLEEIKVQWLDLLEEFGEAAGLQPGQILVLGCSTSEVLGERIGKAGSKDVAEALIGPLLAWADKLGIYLAFQCCEHLNRVLVVEQECADRFGLEQVIVLPSLAAGGAMALTAWERFSAPIAVEGVKAHAGIDIGDTFIGMHLRQVAVPLRFKVKYLGSAHVNFAKTRAKYIGGPRASYPCS